MMRLEVQVDLRASELVALATTYPRRSAGSVSIRKTHQFRRVEGHRADVAAPDAGATVETARLAARRS